MAEPSNPDSEPFIVVTNRDIYRKLVELDDKVDALAPEVAKAKENGERISKLEVRVYGIAGGALAALVAAGFPLVNMIG